MSDEISETVKERKFFLSNASLFISSATPTLTPTNRKVLAAKVLMAELKFQLKAFVSAIHIECLGGLWQLEWAWHTSFWIIDKYKNCGRQRLGRLVQQTRAAYKATES